jgi:hypothetical protein
MLSAILVLLGIAAAIWYFARKQTKSAPSLTVDQTQALINQIAHEEALAADSPSTPSLPSSEVKAAIAAEEEVVVSTEAVKPPKKKRRYYPKKK